MNTTINTLNIRDWYAKQKRLKKTISKKQIKHLNTYPQYLYNTIFQTETPYQLLTRVQNYHTSLSSFRNRRQRSINYNAGKQWSDPIKDPETNQWMTEEQYILKQGRQPLKQNIITKLIRNLVGQFRRGQTDVVVMSRVKEEAHIADILSQALEYVNEKNQYRDQDARNFEEFILSGMPVYKTYYGWDAQKKRNTIQCYTINPARFIFNTGLTNQQQDVLTTVAEIIDTSIEKVISLFSFGKPEKANKIKNMYSHILQGYGGQQIGDGNEFYDSFHTPYYAEKVRYFEVWIKKTILKPTTYDNADAETTIYKYHTFKEIQSRVIAENKRRIASAKEIGIHIEEVPLLELEHRYDDEWFVVYLTPEAQVLHIQENPYQHQQHPYIFHPYPLINGEIRGITEDFIDQQKYINRLIILKDFIIGSSAKGVLMLPTSAIPEGKNKDDFLREWTKANGVIEYNAKVGDYKPEQVTHNYSSGDIDKLLQIQLKLIDDISGVQGAIQGKAPASGTPASLYAMQVENATITTQDIMDTYNLFLNKKNEKILQLIKQYYTETDYYNITEDTLQSEELKTMCFDVKIVKGTNTPTYRAITEDFLQQMLQGGFIDLDMFLENSTMPFAAKLQEQIKVKQEQLQEQQLQEQEQQTQYHN